MVTPGDYNCNHERTTVALCASGLTYLPQYWFSKYPSEVSPTWNIVKVFDPMSWILIFLSILLVSIIFFVSARIGTSYFGIRTLNEEIIFSPFRCILWPTN